MSVPVSPEMHERVGGLLDEIAETEGVRILLAVESGSRAWGFHSPDSDYDVRFIYARPLDWHLSIRNRRDVIERPVDAVLDVSGWELKKALRLALGSNAVVGEWLQSPVVYSEDAEARAALTDFARGVLDRPAVSWHYLSLLRRQLERARIDGGVHLKRYFYALRPALALRWMRLKDAAMPPMDMAALMSGAGLEARAEDALLALIERKKALDESGVAGAPDPVLEALLAEEVALTETWLKDNRRMPPGDEAWQAADGLHRKFSQT